MIRLRLAVSIFAVWITCVAARADVGSAEATRAAVDPIDELVTRLSASPLWQNGIYPRLDLPKTASIDDVIARVFQLTGFDEGHVKEHRILETRVVSIRPVDRPALVDPRFERVRSDPDMYTAVLVDTDLGKKVLLLKYEGTATGWWSRVFPVRSSA